MSYDLTVYDKEEAPKEKEAFEKWRYSQEKQLAEYGQAEIGQAAPDLQAWFMEMVANFPPRRGEFAPAGERAEKNMELQLHLTDYFVGKHMIRASFHDDVKKQAGDVAGKLAMVYDIGIIFNS